MRYLKTQGAEDDSSDSGRRRKLSSGKVARVITGGSRSASSDESDTEQSIRRIIHQRQVLGVTKVEEASLSKEASRSLSADEESTHTTDLQASMLRLQEEEKLAKSQKQQDRKQVFMQVIAQLSGDKSCSLSISGEKSSVSQELVSSGSETEKPGETMDLAARLLAAIESMVDLKPQRHSLRKAIKENRGLRICLYLQHNEVVGVYLHEGGELTKVMSVKEAPERVPYHRVKMSYKWCGGEMRQVGVTLQSEAFSM